MAPDQDKDCAEGALIFQGCVEAHVRLRYTMGLSHLEGPPANPSCFSGNAKAGAFVCPIGQSSYQVLTYQDHRCAGGWSHLEHLCSSQSPVWPHHRCCTGPPANQGMPPVSRSDDNNWRVYVILVALLTNAVSRLKSSRLLGCKNPRLLTPVAQPPRG